MMRMSAKTKEYLTMVPYGGFKAAPWDDINFGLSICNEVVYPAVHDFNFNKLFVHIKDGWMQENPSSL